MLRSVKVRRTMASTWPSRRHLDQDDSHSRISKWTCGVGSGHDGRDLIASYSVLSRHSVTSVKPMTSSPRMLTI